MDVHQRVHRSWTREKVGIRVFAPRRSKQGATMDNAGSKWIAIEAPVPSGVGTSEAGPTNASDAPPSFRDSQFDVILRRQRIREKDALKESMVPSRFVHLSNHFEFAGWGSLELNFQLATTPIVQKPPPMLLGQFTASALAGNAVLGSVFYALPAVTAVAGVYSPISLFIATLALFLWRPILEELGSALPISGAPYTYLLNVTSKTAAIAGASLLLLDFSATVVVSAATAASYLAGEVAIPFPIFLITVLVILLFTCVSLLGLKDSARIALAVLSFHILTMLVLFTVSVVHWGKTGGSQIKENWTAGASSSGSSIAKQIFKGACIGMLGLTGFECTPAYIASIRPGRFPRVLANLHIPAIILNTSMMLLLLGLVPLKTILSGSNVLSVLSQMVGGRWLRIWIVCDAMIVLCGGVLTGMVSACELLERLAHDRVIPAAFLRVIPVTGAPFLSVISFTLFSFAVYASTGASLAIVSKMFSLVWLLVMSIFPVTLLFLKFNRARLPREPQTPLFMVVFALIVTAIVAAGNLVIDPSTAGYFAAYFLALAFVFISAQHKTDILRVLYWTYDQYPNLHRYSLTKMWGTRVAGLTRRIRQQPVCILVRSDEISYLFEMIMYVRRNEETSCVKMVHFHETGKEIPSEMAANAKILDETFPEITIDLILVEAPFTPDTVENLAECLKIPRSLMFISCPGKDFPYSVAELGTRVISM